MTSPPINLKQHGAAVIILGALGFAGYALSLDLFYDVHISFASIFLMLALLRYGTGAAVAASVIAGSYTWIYWHHPWTMLILMTEVLFVGRSLRKSQNIVLLDTLYWLFIGMPLVLISQRFLLHEDQSLVVLMTFKQGVNGIFNALIAAFLQYLSRLMPHPELPREKLPNMHQVLITMMVAAILIPGISYVTLELRRDVAYEELLVRQRLAATMDLTRDLIQEWLDEKMQDVQTLAAMAGDPQKGPSARIQQQAELMKQTSQHFLAVSIQNSKAVSVAFVPAVDGEGKSNRGRDFSSMPYNRILRETRKPVISDIDYGVLKVPRIALFAPMIIANEFRGYCTGVPDLSQLAGQLRIISHRRYSDITMLDGKHRVIASTNPEVKVMEPLPSHRKGDLRWLTDKVYQIVPGAANINDLRRWKGASFGMDSLLGSDPKWLIVIDTPMKPFLDILYHNASRQFALLLVLILFSIAAAQAASAAFVRPVALLERISASLPSDLIRHQETVWPESGIREVAGLIGHVRQMASALHSHVMKLQTLNESLEQRVSDRTEELRRSEQKSKAIFTDAGIGIILADADLSIVDCNPAMERIMGYSRRELIGMNISDISHPDDGVVNIEMVQQAKEPGKVFRIEKRYIRKDGSTLWCNLTISAIESRDGVPELAIGMVEDIRERKQAEEKIRQMAYFDPLTGLPNRALFLDRLNHTLARARREKEVVALLFLDLDRFKDINDTMGHASGDLLLAAVARRLEAVVRKSDTLARFGGDEFVVILSSGNNEVNISTVAQHILEQMEKPHDLDRKEVYISTSIGISLYPNDGDDADSLLKHADMALYAAKERGRNAYHFFSEEMNCKALYHRNIEDSLRHAIQNDELFLEYQPLLDLRSGRIFGVEALVRWNHPQEGLVPPSRFIPVAEETGLIRKIGEWVMRTAALQCRAWQEGGLSVQVAVNVSGHQFNQPGFIEMIDQVLQDTCIDPTLLELELTESSLMEHETIMMLMELKCRGLHIAIDDFGTGYSSLGYLKHFPIDRIKIDRCFVRDLRSVMDDRAIVEAIIAMAHTLGLRVLAEGVETEKELELLRERGCDEAQGYYFGRPMPAMEVENFLRQWQQGFLRPEGRKSPSELRWGSVNQ